MSTILDKFFVPPPGEMSPAQKLGAPLIPLGIGFSVLMILLKKPEYSPVGLLASASGAGLIAFANYKSDRTIVSGNVHHTHHVWDTEKAEWVGQTTTERKGMAFRRPLAGFRGTHQW